MAIIDCDCVGSAIPRGGRGMHHLLACNGGAAIRVAGEAPPELDALPVAAMQRLGRVGQVTAKVPL